jgi:threonine aldolase
MYTTIDLRSDTVTLPTPEMRRAMAEAEVGDDVYGEDPTINRLQCMSAEMLGKEAALFVSSGTMGNLVSILAHCDRGDEIILGDQSHTFINEAGGMSALGGIHPHTILNQPDGTLKLGDIEAAIRADNIHYPITRLIVLENTHNRCGGVPLSAAYTKSVGDLATRKGLKLHIDGARIFNAAVAIGVEARELVEPADSVTFCLSKALCAPVGSVICGNEAFIHKTIRIRKQLGGGMRQAGILAAAGIVALETIVGHLQEDHRRTGRLSDGLKGIKGLIVENDPPPTNMIYLRINDNVKRNALQLAEVLRQDGILVGVVKERRMRLVLHYWIDDSQIEITLNGFKRAMDMD